MRAQFARRRERHTEISLLEPELHDHLAGDPRKLLRGLVARGAEFRRRLARSLLGRGDLFLQPGERALDVALQLELAPHLVARRNHGLDLGPVLPLQLKPGIHLALQLLRLLGVEIQGRGQRGKFPVQVAEFHRTRLQPVGQRLARGIEGLELPCLAQQERQPAEQALLAAEPMAEARGKLHDLLRALLPLKIPLERGGRFLGQVEGIDLPELELEKLDLVDRKFVGTGQPVAFREEVAPLAIEGLVLLQHAAVAGKEVEEFALAVFLEQAARLARPVKVDPLCTKFLQG